MLSSTAIISSQIFFNCSLILIHSFHHLRDHLQHYEHAARTNFIMLATDCLINCLCIFLSFKFRDKWYQHLCSKYHKFCNWFCTKWVKNRIKNQTEKNKALLNIDIGDSESQTISNSNSNSTSNSNSNLHSYSNSSLNDIHSISITTKSNEDGV